MHTRATAVEIVDRLEAEYERSVSHLRVDLQAFLSRRTPPDPACRAGGVYAYPLLRVDYAGGGPASRLSRSFGRFSHVGSYAVSITRPALFRDYLVDQLTLLL